MNRRGFLGILGASAIAGPAAAKNALTTIDPVRSVGIMSALPMGSINPASGEGMSPLGAIERMLKLERLISGAEKEEDDPWTFSQQKRLLAEHDIHALGSVSQSAKIRLLVRASAKINEEEKRRYWLRELTEIKILGSK